MNTAWPYPSALVLFSTLLRDENRRGTYRILINPKTDHPVLFRQFLPELGIKVKDLRMDWIGEKHCAGVFASQKRPNGIGVLGAEEVPDCTAWLTVWTGGGVEHNVDGVRYVHMESGPVLSVRFLCH